ncbi:C39 family peptidase [Kitasatospora sp. NPDC085464]|uniref:C39 family peptidase n=1 Tax=Kitasatospora sp. NPDC085464 TaxID=3364063 RepID=UPI0037C83F3A
MTRSAVTRSEHTRRPGKPQPTPRRARRLPRGGRLTALAAALAGAATLLCAAPSGAATTAVPHYSQQLANDCEAASLRMVLAARGVQVGDQAILARIGVDRVHYQFGVSGPLSGDPYRAFVGDPNGSETAGTGYGVYYPPVARAAGSYGLAVMQAGQGISPSELRAQVAAGHPAIVWVDYGWRDVPAGSYTAYDGRQVLYAGPSEHTVVVSAVRDGQFLVEDPARGESWISEGAFDAGYATYQDMAVIVR